MELTKDRSGTQMLGDLTETPAQRVAELKRRKKPYVEESFRPDEREHASSQGWQFVRENKSSDRWRKPRSVDEQLENEFWRLLYDFGYPRLNIGRTFQITVVHDEHVTKQIDVFAIDDETIIVAECK